MEKGDIFKNLSQMFFPALALALYEMAFIARVTRSSMMEIIREDYMRTARSKGLSERVVLFRHGLKNAILPILTISGWQFGRLFGGTVVIETIFLIPGMGRIVIEAVQHRDFPLNLGGYCNNRFGYNIYQFIRRFVVWLARSQNSVRLVGLRCRLHASSPDMRN
ncbi:MAG: hypothetical protein CM1200mP22_18330 [Dehalococcoidia bacterium]|nr:MAG: hypothetical protein CM1200mP22_18330 [Dehalococcoidia bacterium]